LRTCFEAAQGITDAHIQLQSLGSISAIVSPLEAHSSAQQEEQRQQQETENGLGGKKGGRRSLEGLLCEARELQGQLVR